MKISENITGFTVPKLGDSLKEVEDLLGSPKRPWHGDYCHVYEGLDIWFKEKLFGYKVVGVIISSSRLKLFGNKVINQDIETILNLFQENLSFEYFINEVEKEITLYVPEAGLELEFDEERKLFSFNIHPKSYIKKQKRQNQELH